MPACSSAVAPLPVRGNSISTGHRRVTVTPPLTGASDNTGLTAGIDVIDGWWSSSPALACLNRFTPDQEITCFISSPRNGPLYTAKATPDPRPSYPVAVMRFSCLTFEGRTHTPVGRLAPLVVKQ